MNSQSTSDEITRKLAEMRAALQRDVRSLASEARKCVDWRNHFRTHPWFYCGGAAALGFILVPRRQHALRVVASIAGQAGENQNIELRPAPARQEAGLIHSLLSLAATTVARESLGYLMQRVRQHSGSTASNQEQINSEASIEELGR